jgi:Ca2+-binding EF-hand superfamily protein/predicted ferric reductase
MSALISSADADLIHSLESAIARHSGSDGLIELPELQKALGLKNEHVARRLLRAVDHKRREARDTNDKIDSHAFMQALRALAVGGERARLEFAFRFHDEDADGAISEPEMLRMIAISSGDRSVVTRASQPPDELAKALFRAADADHDGRLTFEEFARAMRKHPELLRSLTQRDSLWVAPQRSAAVPERVATNPLRLLDNHRYNVLALVLWLCSNIAIFMYVVGHLNATPSVPGASWVGLARAFAACLSFNTALVFLPAMRHLVAHIRQSWWGQKLDIDRVGRAQRVLGHVIVGLAWAHAIAYALAFESGHHALGVRRMLTRTYPGSTGALLLLALTALWSLAVVRSRSRRAAYSLYGVLAALIVLHAPSFLIWAALPLLGLGFEIVSRRRKRIRQALVQELVPLRSGVTRITIERPAAFRFDAGNYVFLNLPQIAKHVWHPFTVSSPPEQSDLTLHALQQDEWTVALRKAAERRVKRKDKTPWLAHLDGPHGASSARIFHTRNAVLIGAGDGIAPFASIFGSIVARSGKPGTDACNLRNVQFFWLNRAPHHYEWFHDQLRELERMPVQIQIGVHGCVTGGTTSSTSAALEIAREIQQQALHGLHATAHSGHPDWRIVLTAIADQHAPEPVEVFFCGPPGLGAKLRGHCEHINMRFHEEKF